MSGLLERLGRAAARHKWWFVVAWLVAAVSVGMLAKGLDGQETDNFKIPGAQSQEALDLLIQDFPAASGQSASVVFQSDAGITSPKVQPAIAVSVANPQLKPGEATTAYIVTPAGLANGARP